MISITVDGQELRLYKDTTLSMEMNNALFSADTIEGDVCYGFDIPVSGNELPLRFSHTACAEGARTFACLIAVDGLAAISGRLIVRQSGPDRLSVDVVCNPYPDGWPAQSIRDDFRETVTISRSYTSHRWAWKEFLKASAEENADIKFGLHFNGSNYGNGNAYFGFWNGRNVQQLVNRLYLDADGNVADGQNFYIPALSSFYKSDDSLYMFERKFRHNEGNIQSNLSFLLFIFFAFIIF